MPRRVSFENLKPVKFVIGGTFYTIPAAEFARICDCMVAGTRTSVKEKIALSKMTEEQMETMKLIGHLSAQYGEGQKKKSTFTLNPEQAAEDKRYRDFMKPYEDAGKGQVGKYIYSGDAKSEEEAVALIESNKIIYRQEKVAKVESQKMTVQKYQEKPMEVMTDQGLKIIPLHEFIRICPCSIQLPQIMKK